MDGETTRYHTAQWMAFTNSYFTYERGGISEDGQGCHNPAAYPLNRGMLSYPLVS